MLEGIKPKSVIISSLTDSSDTGHSKLIYIDGKDSKDMARNDSKTKSEVVSIRPDWKIPGCFNISG